MIKTLKGHENCRGRPPTKGACREGPEWIAGFETQKAFFETQEACMVLDAFTYLAVKRRWDGKHLLKRPRDNIIHAGPGYSTAVQPNRPAQLLLPPDTGTLLPQRKFPPWKPWQIHARDWISHTCTGEANRIPGRQTTPAEHHKPPQLPKSRTGGLCQETNKTKPGEADLLLTPPALILHIKAKTILGYRNKQQQSPTTIAMQNHTNQTHKPLNL